MQTPIPLSWKLSLLLAVIFYSMASTASPGHKTTMTKSYIAGSKIKYSRKFVKRTSKKCKNSKQISIEFTPLPSPGHSTTSENSCPSPPARAIQNYLEQNSPTTVQATPLAYTVLAGDQTALWLSNFLTDSSPGNIFIETGSMLFVPEFLGEQDLLQFQELVTVSSSSGAATNDSHPDVLIMATYTNPLATIPITTTYPVTLHFFYRTDLNQYQMDFFDWHNSNVEYTTSVASSVLFNDMGSEADEIIATRRQKRIRRDSVTGIEYLLKPTSSSGSRAKQNDGAAGYQTSFHGQTSSTSLAAVWVGLCIVLLLEQTPYSSPIQGCSNSYKPLF